MIVDVKKKKCQCADCGAWVTDKEKHTEETGHTVFWCD